MKKNFKRTLAKVMAVALTVSMVGAASTDADAAKKIKLSSKSISVAKGATKKVTIKNVKAKKVKKLTVKSANKKIATVKKSGKTAIKVTGKKAGKSTKVTVKVKVGKKTTKLTLKVKVTKAAKKVVPTTAPTAAPAASASAAPTATASTAPTTTPTVTPAATATATPTATATVAPAAKDVPDDVKETGVWNIDLKNETVATKDKDAYRTDVEYGEDGSVTFTNAAEYNGGMVFSLDAEKNAYDLSNAGFKYVKVELTTDMESSLKAFNDASSWWNKFELYEDNTTPAKNRVIYYELSAFEEKGLDLESVEGFGIGFQGGSKGALITIKSMSLVKEKDPEPVVVETPNVEVSLGAKTLEEGSTTTAKVSVESATVESVQWSVDTAAVEVKADEADATNAIVTALSAGTATITANVAVTKDDTKFNVTVSAPITVVKPGEVIYTASMKFADATDAESVKKVVGEKTGVEVSVDTGSIEKIEWSVSDTDKASIEDVEGDADATATIVADKVGEITVIAKVTVKNSSDVQTVRKTIVIVPETVTLTGESLGDNASYTVSDTGLGQYQELCTLTIPSSKITAGATVEIEADVTGVDNATIQWKLSDKKAGGNKDQYVDDGADKKTLKKSFTLATEYDGTKDVTIAVQTISAGFKGTVEIKSVKINSEDSGLEMPAKYEYTFNGISEYTETAKLNLASIKNLHEFNKITIEYTAPEGAQIFGTLHSTKGKYQYSDVVQSSEAKTARTITLDLTDAKVKAAIEGVITDTEAANGELVLGLKIAGGVRLASGTVTITKVTFEG